MYTATLHSYKCFLLLPLSILRPATINTLLSCRAICLEQVLYKCPWNKRKHFTTPVPLHRCICITHAPCKEYSLLILTYITLPAHSPDHGSTGVISSMRDCLWNPRSPIYCSLLWNPCFVELSKFVKIYLVVDLLILFYFCLFLSHLESKLCTQLECNVYVFY